MNERAYLAYPWFDGDKDPEPVRCRSRAMVTIRKPRLCCGNGAGEAHQIEPGSRMLVERGIVDGQWRSWALCTACMDAWLEFVGELV